MSEKTEIRQTEESLARLRLLQGRVLGLSMRLKQHTGEEFDPTGLFCYAALKRTLLAILLVNDPSGFAEAVLKGAKITTLLDREGKLRALF